MSAQTAAAAASDERENKRAHAASQCWSATYPEDLLVLVYTMIASPRVRNCFAAVCRSWRAAARAPPPVPALPWLLLPPRDGTAMKDLYCLEDGALMDLKVPQIIGGHDGGWVVVPVSGRLVRIVNLFSGAEVVLDEKKATITCPSPDHAPRTQVVSRVVFSAPPTSPRCILAAVTQNCGIALRSVGCPNSRWTVQGCHSNIREIVDITFCNGELYGLYKKRKLVKFDIGVDEKDGAPMVTAEHQLIMQGIGRTIGTDDDYWDSTSYIFNLEGKLAMALKARWLPNIPPFFKVFKLVDIHIHMGKRRTHYKDKWLEVTCLDDHALFLGKSFSKAVHVPEKMCGGVERNRIYYSHHCWLGRNTVLPSEKVFLKILNGSSSMTCYKEDDSKNAITDDDDDDVKRIISVGYFTQGGSYGGLWIFPPDLQLL